MGLLRQKLLRFADGERFPILLKANGIPAYLPTVYLAVESRSGSVASNTLISNGRAIMHLYAWAASSGIHIEERFQAEDFLNIPEVESLARACTQFYETLTGSLLANTTKITQLRGTRQVAPSTVSVRLMYIRMYLDWLSQRRIRRLPLTSIERSALESSVQRMIIALKARDPYFGQDAIEPREGLSKESQAKLLEVVCPSGFSSGNLRLDAHRQYTWSRANPWLNPGIKTRNAMLILLMFYLGIRRGELLGLKVSDINFMSNTVTIRRSPDDQSDPRLYEPNTKTLARVLPLNEFIGTILRDYVTKVRRSWAPRKGDHLFLLVARHGGPMSISSVNKMWNTLRTRVPDIPEDICSHVLRHTWNDLFSERMDQEKIPEAREQQMRSNQMGWTPTSKTSAKYTRRSVREAAEKASLELQNKIINK